MPVAFRALLQNWNRKNELTYFLVSGVCFHGH